MDGSSHVVSLAAVRAGREHRRAIDAIGLAWLAAVMEIEAALLLMAAAMMAEAGRISALDAPTTPGGSVRMIRTRQSRAP